MRLQYISDIHLEYLKEFPRFKVNAPNLALLGDIGYPRSKIYQDFIEDCAKRWKNVFLLYGNHEFYNSNSSDYKTIDEIKEINEKNLSKFKNVYILDNNSIYLSHDNEVTHNVPKDLSNNLHIIGSTLWSNITLKASYSINDYRCIIKIKNGYRELVKREDTLDFHNKAVLYISNELKVPCNTVLLSHHGIHDTCNGKYEGNELSSAFCTTIPEFFEYTNLKAAINGHTHVSINKKIKNVELLSNCYGYCLEERGDFDECKVFEYNKSL